ncbi:MAG: PQQ-binding-like beta-propeller repeat protein [Bacteroidales bacterium]|jgi:hypothetical protein|nr:PQQ-binding-like beta-propeller repeat protein [Bacteroidales bacterium]
MKKVSIVFFIFLNYSISFSQSESSFLENQDGFIVGENHITGKNIVAKTHAFDGEISTFLYDTKYNLAALSINKESSLAPGKLIIYNPDTEEITDERMVNTKQDYSSFHIYEGLLFEYYKSGKYYIDINSGGARKWSTKNMILHANKDYNVAISFVLNTDNTISLIKGIDIPTGKILWSRNMKKNLGLDAMKYLNDSVILISSSGLHAMHIRTGKGWKHNATTTSKSGGPIGVSIGVGLTLGLLTGLYFIPTYPYISLYGISSNILIDNHKIYFASADELVCLDEQGKTIWKQKLSKKKSTSSQLFTQNGTLYLMNKGAVAKGNSILKSGEAYLSAYDANSGSLLFLANIEPDNPKPMLDAIVKGNKLCIIYPDQILTLSLSTGAYVKKQPYDANNKGELRYFLGNNVYAIENNEVYDLPHAELGAYCVFTAFKNLLIFDDKLDIDKIINIDNLCTHSFSIRDVDFFKRNNDLLGIDSNGNIIAIIRDISDKAVTANNKIYDVKSNTLLEIDLEQIFN